MSKLDDIPQDVWDKAWKAMGYAKEPRTLTPIHRAGEVARAIMAERERCAVEADVLHALQFEDADYREGFFDAATMIAAAIRKGAS